MIVAPVGKSGPLTNFISSPGVDSGLSRKCTTASIVSPRLCGGMFVAMPTAIPPEPFTSRFGKRLGRTTGCCSYPSKFGTKSTVSASMSRSISIAMGRETRLGVPVRGGRIAVDGAEVAVPVDERVAQRPVLGHPDEGVVHGLVAVRVVLLQHVADHGGGLAVRAVGAVARLEHRPEDPLVDRLQPVADVGQRAADDDRHRVVEVRALDLVLELDVLDAAGEQVL